MNSLILGKLTMGHIAVSRINPAPYNPRVALAPESGEYQKLKRSLEQYGCVEPLVWNERTGNLVGGHQRLAVMLREFGVTSVDVSMVDLDLAHEKALNIALNKIAGFWDDAKLCELLTELNGSGLVDATLTGFDAAEITSMTEQYSQMLSEMGDDGAPGGEPGNPRESHEAEEPQTAEPAGTQIVVGAYRCQLTREQYDAWREDIRQAVGFDDATVIEEIKRRLGIGGAA